MVTVAPYGSWKSPITTSLLVESVVGLGYPLPSGNMLYWVESRPSEGGRYAIVRRQPDGSVHEVLPAGISARTLVHEYGGLCYAVQGEDVYYCDFADQRIYRTTGNGPPVPITPEPPEPNSLRYADLALSPDGVWLVCVREIHSASGVFNDIAIVPTDGSADPAPLTAGHDFYSCPRFSPSADRLAWLSWDHPQMPWDGTQLWEASFDGGAGGPGGGGPGAGGPGGGGAGGPGAGGPGAGEGVPALGPARMVAGGPSESITQPRYSPGADLHYISDRTGWWNIYSDDRAIDHRSAEFCGPDWVFGQSTYTFLDDGTLVAGWSEGGMDRLGYLSPGSRRFTPIEQPYSSVEALRSFGGGIVAVAGSPNESPAIVAISIPSGSVEVIQRSRDGEVDRGYICKPQPIEFPTENGLTSHALFYPPANRDFAGPPGELPPLIVMSHGGPTSATSSVLNYGRQFWTSRGFAVVDVNYGGSTGYGREYRNRLRGRWGIVDVDDCINAARWLAERGEVDGKRMVIRGGSAGGYTTLCALTFHDVFAAGASLYGVADAGALARDTHKFESRYLDGLIGPWPQARDRYEQRSPAFHTSLLRTPMILFQGLEDKVVPFQQAETMAGALRTRGVPCSDHLPGRAAWLPKSAEHQAYRRGGTVLLRADSWVRTGRANRTGRDREFALMNEANGPRPAAGAMSNAGAAWLVFLASGAVLMLEILSLRLVAPYLGLTLETNTAVIGFALASIAAGSWVGGRISDRVAPERLIGPALLTSGVFVLFVGPIVRATGEQVRGGDASAVLLMVAAAIFVPAALLSAVTPMVVKLRLATLAETGRVVGRLSGIGTLGALISTFTTGFLLVAKLPTTFILLTLGGVLIVLGVVLTIRLRSGRAVIAPLLLSAVGAFFLTAVPPPCDIETAYHCARVDQDPANPSGRFLILDTLFHSHIDLADPTFLLFSYIRGLSSAVDAAMPEGPVDALHIGGGGVSYPRYLEATRPGSTSLVLEIDQGVIDLDVAELGLRLGGDIDVRIQDARVGLASQATGSRDLVVGDAFGGLAVPWHLTTLEMVRDIKRVLKPEGVYAVNVIDYPPLAFARAQVATIGRVFEHVAVIARPDILSGQQGDNLVIVGSDRPLPGPVIEANLMARVPELSLITGPEQIAEFVGNATVLTDDFAPVDQLVTTRPQAG
ncbi:MAG: fused MFS/spermidine synthase [Actinomycetota bacterium]